MRLVSRAERFSLSPELHSLLRGRYHSMVKIALRRQNGTSYTINAKRHLHSFESAPVVAAKVEEKPLARIPSSKPVPATLQLPPPDYESAHIGILVTDKAPHKIVEVQDLMDEGFALHGDANYKYLCSMMIVSFLLMFRDSI